MRGCDTILKQAASFVDHRCRDCLLRGALTRWSIAETSLGSQREAEAIHGGDRPAVQRRRGRPPPPSQQQTTAAAADRRNERECFALDTPELFFSLRYFGHLSHSCTKTRRNKVH